MAIAIAVASLNLRPALASVSPVLTDIMADLGISAGAGGMITTVMVVCLGVVSPIASLLSGRIGVERALLAGLIVLCVGLLVRSAGGPVLLYVGAAACGSAIAIMNVLMPGLVKRRFPNHAGILTGLYTTGLVMGASATATFVVPIRDAVGEGWRPAIAAPIVVAVLATVLWAPHALRASRSRGAVPRLGPLLRSRTAWIVSAYMGLQSVTFYVTMAWLPTIYQDAGYSAAYGGFLLGLANLVQVGSTLTVPVLAARARSQVPHVVVAAVLTALAYVGFLVAPTAAPWLWVVVLGIGQGGSISLALLIITLRAPDSDSVVSLSAMAQGFGYIVAAIGPVLIGVLYGATGAWTVPLLAGLGMCGMQLVAGVFAGRPTVVRLAPREDPPAGQPERVTQVQVS